MSNGRPIAFIEYRCGHATPVSGATSATVDRECLACAAGFRVGSAARTHITPSMILGQHPGPYCDCDMCQSRIP